MTVTGSISAGGTAATSEIIRFMPEPESRIGSAFRSVLQGVGSALNSGAALAGGIEPGYQDLINKQIEVQQQMQLVTFYSNIEKSKHETQMAAVRNLRVG